MKTAGTLARVTAAPQGARHGIVRAGLPRTGLPCRRPPTVMGRSTSGCTAMSGVSAPDLPSSCSSLRDLNCTHSNYKTQKSPVSVFIVTTSPCRDWVICAPAAFLGCGSLLEKVSKYSCKIIIEKEKGITYRLSGSLSGIEP